MMWVDENWLGIIHGLDYAASLLLVGTLFFDTFVHKKMSRNIFHYFGLASATSIVWMLFSAADMGGSCDLNRIWLVMSSTSFGHVGCARIVILLLGMLVSGRFTTTLGVQSLLLFLATTVPLLSSLTSHAAMSETHKDLRVLIDMAHACSASIWFGGLYALYSVLETASEPYPLVKRFSVAAMASTGIILATGVLQLFFTFSIISDLWTTVYGRLAIAKIILFFMTLLAASMNHFLHLKNWRLGDEIVFVQKIRSAVRIEFLLLVVLVIVTGFLTRANLPGQN